MARIKVFDKTTQTWVYADKSFGKDGESVTITNITESSEDGGSNSIAFSDGKTINVKNGSKGDKGDTGAAGADGVSPTVTVSKSGKVTTISITDKNGTKTATINDGASGSNGTSGKDGTSVTVKSVSESTADGGSNVVTFSDGKTLTVKNGKPGAAGYTPIKGTDYWTDADQESIVQQVLAALGTPVVGKVTEDNTILIAGVLENGTYTVKYENDDGTATTIGEFTVNDSGSDDAGGGEEATYTNQLPISTDYDGSVFNGTGYQVGKRINSGGTGLSDVSSASTASNPVFVTGFIPCVSGDVVRFKNCYMVTTANSTDASVYGQTIDNFRIMSANGSKTMNWMVQWNQLTTSDEISIEQDENGNVIGFTPVQCNGFIRLVLAGDPTTAIITINEEIPD